MVVSHALFVATGLVLVLQIRGHRRQQRLARLEREQQLQRRQLLQAQHRQQQLEAEAEKNRAGQAREQKGQKHMLKALKAANKFHQLRELLSQLQPIDNPAEKPRQAINQRIRKLQKELDSSEERRDFTTYFEQENVSFLVRLVEAHPALTASELRYLSLVCLNLSNKEIAKLLHITPEYSKKRKQQIARKMGLASPSELYAYLASLQS
ncbi:MAG: hypothetical protein SPK03_01975 [Alloprevotella sp.]|nr:hypothetical protein [Alloprevotella sp.]